MLIVLSQTDRPVTVYPAGQRVLIVCADTNSSRHPLPPPATDADATGASRFQEKTRWRLRVIPGTKLGITLIATFMIVAGFWHLFHASGSPTALTPEPDAQVMQMPTTIPQRQAGIPFRPTPPKTPSIDPNQAFGLR